MLLLPEEWDRLHDALTCVVDKSNTRSCYSAYSWPVRELNWINDGTLYGLQGLMNLPTLNSETSSVVSLVSVGQSSGFSLRNDGPFIQRPLISLTVRQRGHRLGLTSWERVFKGWDPRSLDFCNSHACNGLSREDSERSQARTIMESDQNVTFEGLILNSSLMGFASRDANRAASVFTPPSPSRLTLLPVGDFSSDGKTVLFGAASDLSFVSISLST